MPYAETFPFEPEAEVQKLRCMPVQNRLGCICEEPNVMMQVFELTFTEYALLAGFEGLYETHCIEQYGCP